MKKRMNILAVDDSPLNLDVLTETLDDFYNVSATISGKDALEMLREEIPDLILLDIMMPEMDGYEVCRIIKENKKWADIPVIFLTAKNETEDIVRAYETGAADYISKPFNPPELLARVKAHLEIKTARDTIKRQNEEQKEMLHILCHDLANPFSSVLGVLDIITSDNFSEFAPLLKQSAEHGLGVISLVRQMRKLDEKPIELELLSLTDTLSESIDMLSRKFTEKKIVIDMNIDSNLLIKAERTSLINSVFNNILTNAVKFSYPDGTIEINASKKDGKIRLSIADHGIGIPDYILDTIFNVNQNTSRTGTNGEEGTGFGMPLVRKFMLTYGGEINIISAENKGTEVELFFQNSL